MRLIIDEWGLKYPGVKKVEHVYFYHVPMSDNATRLSYLKQAYNLGKDFSL
jgi:NAD(P)H dehydrogenase (quinone)